MIGSVKSKTIDSSAFSRRAAVDVVLGARRAARRADIAGLAEAGGQPALAVETDIVDPNGCDRLVGEAMTMYGRVDVLVNNAGIASPEAACRRPRGWSPGRLGHRPTRTASLPALGPRRQNPMIRRRRAPCLLAIPVRSAMARLRCW